MADVFISYSRKDIDFVQVSFLGHILILSTKLQPQVGLWLTKLD